MPRVLSPFEQQFIFLPPPCYTKVKVLSLKCIPPLLNAGEKGSRRVAFTPCSRNERKKVAFQRRLHLCNAFAREVATAEQNGEG